MKCQGRDHGSSRLDPIPVPDANPESLRIGSSHRLAMSSQCHEAVRRPGP